MGSSGERMEHTQWREEFSGFWQTIGCNYSRGGISRAGGQEAPFSNSALCERTAIIRDWNAHGPRIETKLPGRKSGAN